MKELVILVADAAMEAVLRTFFEREAVEKRLGCGEISIDPVQDIFRDRLHTDGGVHRRAHEILRPYIRTHRRAMVVLDQQFGAERPADQVRFEILDNLRRNGWPDRCEVVVIDPELEVWLWQDSPHVARAVGHQGIQSLREHLAGVGDWPENLDKPKEPKGTLHRLVRENRVGVATGVYCNIAKQVSVKGCVDESFQRFLMALRDWFPAEGR